jgi:glycosyltransferase involved in cell wall biosynthesis
MISVIIPCYNAERTLAATITSALDQEIEKEVIVVNDGSTDGSAEIIEKFADRIRTLFTPNRGVSSARESGTKLAVGRYIQYLDSDDLLAPGTLGARLDAIVATKADVVYTDWQRMELGPEGTYVLADILQPDLDAIERDAEVATATSEFWAPPAALLYRREIVERIGGWPAGLPIIQDARYLFEAARRKARFVYVAGVGAYYRVSPNSLSQQNLTRFIVDCARNASEIETIWRGQGALVPSRVDALARMWAHVVTAALLNGLDEFDEARARYNGLTVRRSLFEAGFLLRRMVGASTAASVLRAGLQSKRTLRRWTAGVTGPEKLAIGRRSISRVT